MDKVYKIIEVVGCSSKSYEEAIRNAVEEAGRSLKGLAWFEVKEWRGGITDGKVTEFQAVTKVGFRLIGD
ncbi:MAG TPA: dodecin [Acidobacteriota bacterium]|nr:dodecin [Acidobacteriota bacterium]